MILVTGNKNQGFTLIEIVLVVGLIALGSGLVIANLIAFTDTSRGENPAEVLHRAVRDARYVAASEKQIARLKYDEERGALRVLPSEALYPLGEAFENRGAAEVRFYFVSPSRGLGRGSNSSSQRVETSEVLFAPDRSSTPFVAEIDMGSGAALQVSYDPFSGSVLNEEQ